VLAHRLADLLHLGDVVKIADEHAALLRDGMDVLVGYLGNVRDGVSEGPAHQGIRGSRSGSRVLTAKLSIPSRNLHPSSFPTLRGGVSSADRGTWKMVGGTGALAGKTWSGWWQVVFSEGKTTLGKWGGTCN